MRKFGGIFTGFAIVFACHTSYAEVKEWTFLTFINAKNNLDKASYVDINEMESVGSTDKINVVVQWASLKAQKTVRMFVTKDELPREITSPVIEDLGSVDMGDVKNFVEFVKWGVQNYPAKHYFINIWSHGNGWLPAKEFSKSGRTSTLDISFDDVTNNVITTQELGQALQEISQFIGKKVDIYGSDACLMAMPEVSTEMSKYVEVYAGSEELSPNEGWPYHTLLAAWNALSSDEANARVVAKILTQKYINYYQKEAKRTREDVTFSAFDLTYTHELLENIRQFVDALKVLSRNYKSDLQTALRRSESFDEPGLWETIYGTRKSSDYGDLLDFIKNISEISFSAQDKIIFEKASSDLLTTSQKFIVANQTGKTNVKSQGISVWLPKNLATLNKYKKGYLELEFNKETQWVDALTSIFEE